MRQIFATTNYKYMLEALMHAQHKNQAAVPIGGAVDPRTMREGTIYFKEFPDGETHHQFNSTITGKHVIIVGGTVDDSETLELFDMACHCAKNGARNLTLVIPYFGYSTMERAVKAGEIVKAKTRAILLSAIPAKIHVLFMDLHSEGTPHYLEGSIQAVHLYAKRAIIKMCKKISNVGDADYKLNTNFVLASTDAGRAKWVESLANEIGVECAIITKRRLSGTSTEIVGINADVKGKNVVIYDDMIRTGGSLIAAGAAYKEAGAAKVFAVATHGVLPGTSIYKLKDSGVFDKVYVTNTHPNAVSIKAKLSAGTTAMDEEIKKSYEAMNNFYHVFDIAPIIYRYMHRH